MTPGSQGYPQHVVHGFAGAVAAGGALAASAGLDALRRGGNAVDAVIAATGVQAVVELPWGGVGGDAFVLVRTPTGRLDALNGSGVAPRMLGRSLGDGTVVPRFGSLSVGVPGFVGAIGAMHARYGSRPLPDLLAPAVDYAADGFPVSHELHAAIQRVMPELHHDAPLRRLLRENGRGVGARFRQPALAATLGSIAESGAEDFYDRVGKQIAMALQARGGVLTADDMASHAAPWVEPVSAPYGQARVTTHPPVSLGCVLLLQLKLYERLGLPYLPPNDATRIDAMVRCKHVAFAHALRTLEGGSDPAEVIDDLFDDAALDQLAARLLSLPVHQLDSLAPTPDGADTTCVVAADSQGYVAAVIHSLFNEFGSRELDESSGVLLNDRLANQRIAVNGRDGLLGGARPLHTLNAVLVERNGEPAMMLATPGGRGQVQTSFQVLVNTIGGGLDPQVSIDAPRWLSGAPRRPKPNDQLYLEPGLAATVETDLRERGHLTVATDDDAADLFGSCVAVGHGPDASLYAAADRRREARTAAF